VSNLPPRSREAIVLRYVADLTEAGVADAMGVKEGSASALLHKARAALRRSLDEEAYQ
jgi:RNA polymerase sigma factor (sigma-70 family)